MASRTLRWTLRYEAMRQTSVALKGFSLTSNERLAVRATLEAVAKWADSCVKHPGEGDDLYLCGGNDAMQEVARACREEAE